MVKVMGRVAVAIVALGLVVPVAVYAQDAIKNRKDDMQILRKSVGAIKGVVDGKDAVDTAAAPAQAVADVAKRLAAGFPVGSDQGDTKALAAIWTDKAGFDAAVANFNTAAGALLVASNAKNLDGIKAAFGEVGKSCGACHDKYRGK